MYGPWWIGELWPGERLDALHLNKNRVCHLTGKIRAVTLKIHASTIHVILAFPKRFNNAMYPFIVEKSKSYIGIWREWIPQVRPRSTDQQQPVRSQTLRWPHSPRSIILHHHASSYFFCSAWYPSWNGSSSVCFSEIDRKDVNARNILVVDIINKEMIILFVLRKTLV